MFKYYMKYAGKAKKTELLGAAQNFFLSLLGTIKAPYIGKLRQNT